MVQIRNKSASVRNHTAPLSAIYLKAPANFTTRFRSAFVLVNILVLEITHKLLFLACLSELFDFQINQLAGEST